MIIFSKFVCGSGTVSEALRAVHTPSHLQPRNDLIRFSTEYRPLVVWNMTNRCNLKCQHCYIDAKGMKEAQELTTEEAKKLLKDLATIKIPIVLFSGGEPLIRPDFKELVIYGRSLGLRIGISTNGTLIDDKIAKFLMEQGVSYVGVSLDAAQATIHDEFRGVTGSFDRAIKGLKIAKDVGLKTGARITVNKSNYKDVPKLYELVKELGIPRFCLYYLVPSGRGQNIMDLDLNPDQREEIFDFLYQKALEEGSQPDIEILTTDAPHDGPLLIEKLQKSGMATDDLQKLMTISGGCSAGEKIANVDHLGNVHACQFWTDYSLGNVKEKSFSEIWGNDEEPLLKQLREKDKHLTGKCGTCYYKIMCKGCRLRARHVSGELFGTDPSCIYIPSDKSVESSVVVK